MAEEAEEGCAIEASQGALKRSHGMPQKAPTDLRTPRHASRGRYTPRQGFDTPRHAAEDRDGPRHASALLFVVAPHVKVRVWSWSNE